MELEIKQAIAPSDQPIWSDELGMWISYGDYARLPTLKKQGYVIAEIRKGK